MNNRWIADKRVLGGVVKRSDYSQSVVRSTRTAERGPESEVWVTAGLRPILRNTSQW